MITQIQIFQDYISLTIIPIYNIIKINIYKFHLTLIEKKAIFSIL